jgi:Fic family protein
MGRREQRIWQGKGPESGLSRGDRQGCRYAVYIPDRLHGRKFTFDSSSAADVSDAERATRDLDAKTSTLADTETFARLLLRAESVASSKIEGLVVGARRLLRTDAARALACSGQCEPADLVVPYASGEDGGDVTAAEVLGNIEAMKYALQTLHTGSPITVPVLLETHRRLLGGTALGDDHGGRIRGRQNWIGGSSYKPCAAVFVPPPPEIVEALLVDLYAFCNEDSLPPVAQAAIAHAQFENIHPFADGNGPVERALIHMVFRSRGLTQRVSPPVSLVLATDVQDYLEGLRGTAYDGPPDSKRRLLPSTAA